MYLYDQKSLLAIEKFKNKYKNNIKIWETGRIKVKRYSCAKVIAFYFLICFFLPVTIIGFIGIALHTILPDNFISILIEIVYNFFYDLFIRESYERSEYLPLTHITFMSTLFGFLCVIFISFFSEEVLINLETKVLTIKKSIFFYVKRTHIPFNEIKMINTKSISAAKRSFCASDKYNDYRYDLNLKTTQYKTYCLFQSLDEMSIANDFETLISGLIFNNTESKQTIQNKQTDFYEESY